MIVAATHHLGLRADNARLCEAGPGDRRTVANHLPYLAEQLAMGPPVPAKACTDCLVTFWNIQWRFGEVQ